MSGLISSLLIESVIRRTRRLSNATPPSSNDHSQCIQDRITSHSLPDNNGHGETNMLDQMQEHTGLGCGYAGPGYDPASLPTSTLDSGANRRHETNAVLPGRSESGTEYSQAIETPVPPTSPMSVGYGRGADASTTPTQGVSRPIATSNMQDRRHSSGRVLNMDDIGGQSLLPEDDGMGVLRRKIHAIRDMGSDSTEKARMIHELMTENYNASRGESDDPAVWMAFSPSSPRSPELLSSPISHGNVQSFDQLSATLVSTPAPGQQTNNPYNLTEEDLKPTFFPKDESDSPVCGGEDIDTEEFEEAILGCQHYKRNVKLQCVACKKWYTCRFCHDEIEDHHLIRHKTENMLCMMCGHAQPASDVCEKCGEEAAHYFCEVCKLWDNDSKKSIYHCADCGICRIGQGLGKDFFHCKTCSVCLPISIENTHRCIERSTQCDCPICSDYMFTSPETVVVMRCGHSIHHKCLSEYSKNSYRCPICSKTITNMESTFRNLDRAIQSQPMPAEFKDTKALIYCNDCGAKSVTGYHWLGLKCDMCESYNTAQIRVQHGDMLEPPEQGDDGRRVSRMRSSSHGADEVMSQAMAPLRINANPVQDTGIPQQSAPSSADPNGRFSSYNLTRGRAVSPVVSNYFGLPPNRESEESKSISSFFGGRAQGGAENDHGGELHIWGTKFKYNYGFLSRETESVDGTSEADGEENVESSDGSGLKEEDEEDDDDESIDIFGHR